MQVVLPGMDMKDALAYPKYTGKDGDTVGEKDEEIDSEIGEETAEEEATGQAAS